MTGWRIGWLVHPASLDRPMEALAQANNTGTTHFIQYGALAALSPEGDAFRATLLEHCRKGRDAVDAFLAGSKRMRWLRPEGAFYGFLEIDGLKDSLAFARMLVEQAGVGVSPGATFGRDARDDHFERICFAQDAARVGEGLARLERGISKL